MIIVCTQDNDVRNNQAGTAPWGPFNLLNNGGQPGATVQMRGFIRQVTVAEALCLSAHGNNTEIGDEESIGWVWSAADIANLLNENLPAGYSGKILISACATNVVNFSANLAQALRDQGWRIGLWIYGYNTATPAGGTYPNPGTLDQNLSLQGTQV